MDDKETKVPQEQEVPTENKAKPANMRNIEDIMAEYIANGEVADLDKNERALIDRQVFEKTGKHIAEFKNPKKSKVRSMPVVSSGDSTKGQKDATPHNLKPRKELPVAPSNPKANAGYVEPPVS